jgi:mxaA protein
MRRGAAVRLCRAGLAAWAACAALLAGAQSAATGTAARTPHAAVVIQPRPFGYVIGDLLTQRVLLENSGASFEPARLPKAERIDVWLERRGAHIESGADGRRWLIVT